MKHRTFIKGVFLCTVALMVGSSLRAAEQPARQRRGGLYGDWQIKVQFGERQMDSILSFSRDQDRNLTGQWISFWGITDLSDVKFEEGKLSFTQTVRFGDNEFTSNFAGTITEGKLAGTLTSDRGESKVEGKRWPRTSRAVGNWLMKYTIGERELTSTLAVRTVKSEKDDEADKLTARWQSDRGEHEITDLAYERGNLTFKRKTKIEDRQWESTFEGTIERDTLSGTFKSDRGDIPVEGTLLGVPLMGTWNLEVTSERGVRKQRLVVNRDMSGLYGSTPIKEVTLNGDKVSFKIVMAFGEQPFEMSFAGKLDQGNLTGEMTTSQGVSKIAGKKVVRQFRRPNNQ
ncbi:MAG: hypothetical protein JW720_04850 [Sedimentisphaerales bacterium]|nr:hypothetical protein [Sedimentisphaerales bacterium]